MNETTDPAALARTEAALRDWLAAEASAASIPASLAEALPNAAARPATGLGATLRTRDRGRLALIRGLASAAAVAAVVLGALALSSANRQAASTASAPASTAMGTADAASVTPSSSPQSIPTPRAPAPALALAWTRLPHATGSLTGSSSGPALAARPNGGFLTALATTAGIEIDASPDGRTWSKEATVQGSGLALAGLVWDGSRYVLLQIAAQPSWPGTPPPGVDTTPYVFTSADGRSWTRRRASIGELPSEVRAVAARAGHIVLAGWARSEQTLWTSSDGLDWGTPPGWDPADRVLAVAGSGAGFVATGTSAVGAAAWTSRDGHDWAPARVEQPPDGSSPAIEAVARDPDGYFGVGTRVAGQGADGSAVRWGGYWTSPDGASWSFHDAPGLDGVSFETAVWLPNATLALAVDPAGEARLVDTPDGGATWNAATVPAPPSGALPPEFGPRLVTDGRGVLLDAGAAYFVT